MKVKCISQCQYRNEKLYLVGKTYDIPEEIYNKEYFEKIQTKEKKGE